MKFSLRSAGCGLALLILMGTAICHGWEGDSMKLKRIPWFEKRGFTPLQIYTSSDLVGPGRLEAFRLIPEGDCKDEFRAIATMSFTNVLKGEAGPCDVYISIAHKDPVYSDISSLSEEVTVEENDRALKGDWKWQTGNTYILICVTNAAMSRWELHSVVTQTWPDYVRVLREKVREYSRGKAERATRKRVLSEKLAESHEAMQLGDISTEEYEKHLDEYREALEAIDQGYSHYPLPCFPDGAEGMFGGPIDWGRLKNELGDAQ